MADMMPGRGTSAHGYPADDFAIEHGATLATTDRDFSRFPGLRTTDPRAT